ncbi:hypothetical protein ASG36_05210 [Geodermatophilus sp. Leaf369]|nr:hypothetical protein ASG36_05210 [Geodermatophilus sp. Leaf369]
MDEPWRAVIADVLRTHHGLATRDDLLRRVPRTVVDSFVGRGHLRRVFPRVYAPRGDPATGDRRLRAALMCAGPGATLSHLTALAVVGLREHAGPVHVVIDHSRRHAGAPDLQVHRRRGLSDSPHLTDVVRGLPVTPLAVSLVDSWPLVPRGERRPMVIDAVRRTRLDAHLLRAALDRRPNIGGHRALAETIALIADGVQSELEAMGVLGVFRHRSLPRSRGQVRVVCPDGVTRHLDRAWEEVLLAVELDGAAFHTSPADRQGDLHRDAVLASLGWLVLRFTYAEVVRDPEGVRATVLAVYRTRLAQLSAA